MLINLAPADVKKEATALDMPITIGILRSDQLYSNDSHRDFLIAGELALDDPGAEDQAQVVGHSGVPASQPRQT